MGRVSIIGIAGYEIRLQHFLSILVEKQVLSGQIDFHIAVTIIVGVPAVCPHRIDKIPVYILSGLDIRHQLGDLPRLIDPPAVVAAGHRNGLAVGRGKRFCLAIGIILFRHIGYKTFHQIFIENDLQIVAGHQPGSDGVLRDLLLLRAHLVGNLDIGVVVHGVHRALQFLAVSGNCRLHIAVVLRQIHLGFQCCDGFSERVRQHCLIDLISINLVHNHKLLILVCVCGVLGRGCIRILYAGKTLHPLIQLIRVICNHAVQGVILRGKQRSDPGKPVLPFQKIL